MTEQISATLRESKTARWLVLILISVAMLTAYLFMEIISPLKTMIQSSNEYGWSNTEWGIVTGAQGYLNVFAGMLIIGGIILDKMGVRFTAVMSAIIMVGGAALKYYAFVGVEPTAEIFGIKSQIFISASGFAIFCVGAETAGITVSKIIVKWFKGKELALAMGLEMASARLGSFAALFFAPRIAAEFQISMPILLGALGLLIGLILFLIYTVMDVKLDRQEKALDVEEEEPFKISDIKLIITNRGWWYIAILCVLFYSAVFPFYKYGPDLMVNKFGVNPETAGDIPSLLPFGTLFLTPLFGTLYDRMGKGATIMMVGAAMLIGVHVVLFIPSLTDVTVAVVAAVFLGIAFSLVPSAMWPSVPKIIPEKQLGSAFALIFYIQNIGLSGIPILLGYALDKTNPGVAESIKSTTDGLVAQGLSKEAIAEKLQELRKVADANIVYDYSSTWLIFVGLTITALVFAILLKAEDKKKGYGLELPNVQK